MGIAIVATTPWDSYLIQRKIWTYPSSVIIGPRLFSIPAEEVFFFAIQTYNTSLLYLLLSKAVFKPAFLVGTQSNGLLTRLKRHRAVGQAILTSIILAGALLVQRGGEGTYLGLILAWAGPFALLL
jgi:15-cis-phytoene synthase / lycopene beta-cyclase